MEKMYLDPVDPERKIDEPEEDDNFVDTEPEDDDDDSDDEDEDEEDDDEDEDEDDPNFVDTEGD